MSEHLFTAFRNGNGPTQYEEQHTPVTADVLLSGLVYCTLLLMLAGVVVLPGIRGKKRLYCAVRGFLTIYVGATIVIAIFGQEWAVSTIHTQTRYRAGTDQSIEADVGVKIGLQSINITLKGTPENQLNEQINYNERFAWTPSWSQGRNYYSPFSGQINQEFRDGQYRGLPYPILWIAEYFTIDAENIRWGRSYRMSGYYAYIMMWSAFPTWIIANILLFMVINYAAYFMILTGVWLLLANFLYIIIRWGSELNIPFDDGVLVFRYGWSFWIAFSTGWLCLVYGCTVLVCNKYWPEKTAEFFDDYDRRGRKRDHKKMASSWTLNGYQVQRSNTAIVMETFNGNSMTGNGNISESDKSHCQYNPPQSEPMQIPIPDPDDIQET